MGGFFRVHFFNEVKEMMEMSVQAWRIHYPHLIHHKPDGKRRPPPSGSDLILDLLTAMSAPDPEITTAKVTNPWELQRLINIKLIATYFNNRLISFKEKKTLKFPVGISRFQPLTCEYFHVSLLLYDSGRPRRRGLIDIFVDQTTSRSIEKIINGWN